MIQIDDEFQSLIPPLSPDEFELLETNIKAEGCRDALVLWGDVLIDGHNRYAICQKHEIPYGTIQKEFDSREDAIIWIVNNQLGRRNITAFVRAELALRMKDAIADKAKNNQGTRTDIQENFPESFSPLDTGKELSKVAQVSDRTIDKVEKVAKAAPEPIKQAARAGELSVDRAYRLTKAVEDAPEVVVDTVLRYAADEPEKAEILHRLYKSGLTGETNGTFDEISRTGGFHYGDDMQYHIDFKNAPIEKIRHGLDDIVSQHAKLGLQRGAPKALQMSVSNEWYTPKQYIEAARQLMGAIDLDPASNPIANQVVQAKHYYTIETNGLDKPWTGRVWLNPPYGKEDGESNQDRWSARLIEQYRAGITTEAVLLVNAVTDRKWFQALWDFPICFTKERVKFYDENGEAGQPTHGNVFVYFGSNPKRFAELFQQWGRIVVPQGAYSEVLPNAA